MIRKSLTALVVLAAVSSLEGCAGGSAENPDTWVSTGTEDYKGETLRCAAGTYGPDCDFDLFYAEHPDLLAEPATQENSDGLYFRSYRGEVLTCIADAYSPSCDFEGFYAEHPDLLAEPSMGSGS